jgi:Cof subfamily protein (haloacid dehalogenase superfamily)
VAEARVRLIASDLDGTLLGEDGRISDRTLAAIQRAHERGIIVVAATGRSHRTAAPRLRPAPAIGTAVCSNGASVYDMDRQAIVRHRPIGDGIVPDLIAALRQAHSDVCFAWETEDGFGWEQAMLGLAPVHMQDGVSEGSRALEVHQSIDDVEPERLTKLLVGHPIIHSNVWLAEIGPLIPSNVQASTSGAAFVEITGEGVDKASTLSLLCAELGVDAAEVVAFGDQSNDIAMLRWAGRGLAPANAHEAALEAADAVIGHHADDGVAAVIEQLAD